MLCPRNSMMEKVSRGANPYIGGARGHPVTTLKDISLCEYFYIAHYPRVSSKRFEASHPHLNTGHAFNIFLFFNGSAAILPSRESLAMHVPWE
jgi:hypothetical protein